MRSSNEEKKNNPAGQASQQDAELSETWRALLGLQSSQDSEEQPVVQVEPLAGDPWGHLIQSQGMQSIDLQKIHLHELYPAANDDVEHALNIMREATGQLPALDKQAREKDA